MYQIYAKTERNSVYIAFYLNFQFEIVGAKNVK